jgi:hypothetical protein
MIYPHMPIYGAKKKVLAYTAKHCIPAFSLFTSQGFTE